MKITVNQIEFKSKLALETYVRELLFSVRKDLYGTFEIDDKDKFEFMLELFRRHPDYAEKAGNGIEKIFVMGNELNRNAPHVIILRKDNTSIDISWKICVAGIGRNIKSIQLEIMRESIVKQIMEFRNTTVNICNLCKVNADKYDIDHYEVEFKELASKFMNENTLPSKFKEQAFGHAFHDDDLELEQKWQQYHLHNAKLQKLCKSCHKKKTYKRKLL